jgi:flagellar biosynthesis chaperone FliJ
MAGYEKQLKQLWETVVSKSSWRKYAHQHRIPGFQAFQKVNMARYLQNLETTLVPP